MVPVFEIYAVGVYEALVWLVLFFAGVTLVYGESKRDSLVFWALLVAFLLLPRKETILAQSLNANVTQSTLAFKTEGTAKVESFAEAMREAQEAHNKYVEDYNERNKNLWKDDK